MGNWGKRALLIFLALTLILALAVSASAEGAAQEETKVTDFVLVIDCSASLKNASDKDMKCADACKMFLDLIPVEASRVSVIAFGYDGEDYQFQNYDVNETFNVGQVHTLAGLTSIPGMRERQELKQRIDTAMATSGQKTPFGTATLAAMDVLLSGGATDGNACIVLVSDGRLTAEDRISDTDNLETAIATAKTHQWPVYSIELNDDGVNNAASGEGKQARDTLNRLCEETGAGSEGRREIRAVEDLVPAFVNIFGRFMKGQEMLPITVNTDSAGYLEQSLELPYLASEANLIVTGDQISRLEFTTPSGKEYSFNQNYEAGDMLVTMDPLRYSCAKIICPEAGTWQVRVYGTPNTKVTMYSIPIQELELYATGLPVGEVTEKFKTDTISFHAVLKYGERELVQKEFYQNHVAELVLTHPDGHEETIDMDSSLEGYSYELALSQLEMGDYTARVQLVDNMFRSGYQASSPMAFSLTNRPLVANSGYTPLSLSGYVNGTFETIDTYEFFTNEDGDPVSYSLVCNTDRNVTFDCQADEAGYLTISTGLVPGNFDVSLQIQDIDMDEPLSFDLTLEVLDHPIETQKIDHVELWSDAYAFQSKGPELMTLDLSEYFRDPDGLPVEFLNWSYSTPEVASHSLSGSVLTLTPLEKGDTVLTFTATDGVDTQEGSIEIHVVSGKTAFWRDNWWWMALSAAVLLAILLIVLVLLASKGVKGVWEIEIYEDLNDVQSQVANVKMKNMREGRKKKFYLQALLQEMYNWIPSGGELSNIVPAYFRECQANKLMLCGVIFGSGCVVKGAPAGEMASVTYNGVPVSKSGTRVKRGVLCVALQNQQGGTLRITMRVL